MFMSEQGEALAPRPAEEQEDEEPKSPSTEEEGVDRCVAIKKAPFPTSRSRSSIATPILSRYQSALHLNIKRRLRWWRSRALRFWVSRRRQRHRYLSSDTLHVAISLLKSGRNAMRVASCSRRRQGHRRDQHRFPPQRRSLSRPHIPCVRLEHSLEGLRKSSLTVDSHTVAGLVVPVAT
ncbi:hypothetical protein Taro_021150 [Colocasia esculenta]|uniref:Uncharacterized protein n=1 Tax=Colocasia esculenta TaxID=4460 RepID=A0A843V469_COLES|nr:hypothetical protein [Colocasia esculenta]